ncbi:MAG: S8 family serine peptidase [Clostridia bacterium]|nr:S8 family serine peptidase [Clostridia bacterium]
MNQELKKNVLSEEELILAPQPEVTEQVFNNQTTNTRLYSFLVEYSSPEKKETLLNQLKELRCIPEMHLDFINCVSVCVTMDTLAKIKALEAVRRVERNYEFTLLSEVDGAVNPACADQADYAFPEQNAAQVKPTSPFESLHAQEIKGQKIKIALLDTGITAHPDLKVAGGISFVGNQYCYEDTNGHGTQMAGIIAASGETHPGVTGAAPLAELYGVKVFDEKGLANTAAVMAGIHWAMEHKMNIVNMSFGTYFKSHLLQKVIDMAAKQGLILVAAAGNEGTFKENRLKYPAAYRNVLAVGSGSAQGVASFSNQSEELDFVAPGRLDTTTLDGKFTHVVGTSASAAYVTGELAALWSGKPRHKAKKILNAAKAAGNVAKSPKGYVGYGELDPAAALTNFEEYSTLTLEKSAAYSTVATVESEDELVLAPASLEADPAGSISLFCIGSGSDGDCDGDGDSGSGSSSSSGSSSGSGSSTGSSSCSGSTCESSANTMDTAYALPFNVATTGCIQQDTDQVWYKITTNDSEAHPNGSPGWYFICTGHTESVLDTVGYLYDASGNYITDNDDYNGSTNFGFWVELNYNQTYYIKVMSIGAATGSFLIRADFLRDDHGNDCASATDLFDVSCQDITVSSQLHFQNDIDYYRFYTSRDCVMEIYTESDIDTFGTLNIECDGYRQLAFDNNSNGNNNFKITYHLEAMKYYYIAVKSDESLLFYPNYTLKFKFVKDYMPKPDLGSLTDPNYLNLRTYINWIPNYMASTTTSLIGYVGVTPIFEEETIIGRTWMNWSTAEHWNLHVIDNTEENAESILNTLADYAAETITSSYLTAVFCSVFALQGTAATVAGAVIGGIVSLFANAIDSNSKNDETEKFQNFARDITNDNTKWIMGEGINYKNNLSVGLYDPTHSVGTNKIYYEMDNNDYFYGYSGMRGTFVMEFAEAQ